jgi:hypothetical protein
MCFSENERFAVGLWRKCLCLVLMLCKSAWVWKLWFDCLSATLRRWRAWPVMYALVALGVHGHEAWFVTDPALCDHAWVGHFRNVNSWWRGLNVLTGIRPFPPASARFPAVGHAFCPRLCYSVAIRTFLAVPAWLSKACCHVSSASWHFLSAFHRGSYPGSGAALQSSTMPIISCLSAGWGRSVPPECSGARFVGPGG